MPGYDAVRDRTGARRCDRTRHENGSRRDRVRDDDVRDNADAVAPVVYGVRDLRTARHRPRRIVPQADVYLGQRRCPNAVVCAGDDPPCRAAQGTQIVNPAGRQLLRYPCSIDVTICACCLGSGVEFAIGIPRDGIGFQGGTDLAPGCAAVRAGENARAGRRRPEFPGIRGIEFEVEDPLALKAGSVPANSAIC